MDNVHDFPENPEAEARRAEAKRREEKKAASKAAIKRRQEFASIKASRLKEEAEEITQRLNAKVRIEPQWREHFARYCHKIFEELDKHGRGAVREVIQAAFPKEADPSRRRGRFSLPDQSKDATQPLAAAGSSWARIATEAGRKLDRDHRVLIDMVRGTPYSVASGEPLLGGLGDAVGETVSLLNRMATACVRENRLNNYFETLRFSLYEIQGEELVAATALPEAANVDRLVDGMWIDIEPGFSGEPEKPFLPKVPLYTRSLLRDTFERTRLGLSQEDYWNAESPDEAFGYLALTHGTEHGQIEFSLDVSISIAPVGPKKAAVGCFFVEPKAFVIINGQPSEIWLDDDRAWIPATHEDRLFGIRIAGRPNADQDWNDHIGCYLLETINPESCLKWLPGISPDEWYDFDYHVSGWDWPVDDLENGPERAPTAAPSSSVMAVVQSNLAYVPDDDKISTLLNRDAARLVGMLANAQARDSRRYRDAIRPLIEKWESDNE